MTPTYVISKEREDLGEKSNVYCIIGLGLKTNKYELKTVRFINLNLLKLINLTLNFTFIIVLYPWLILYGLYIEFYLNIGNTQQGGLHLDPESYTQIKY